MNIKTAYNLGQKVIVFVDGRYTVARITTLSAYASANQHQINYEAEATDTKEAKTKNGIRTIKTTRKISLTEAEITKNMKLFIESREKNPEATGLELLWMMSKGEK